MFYVIGKAPKKLHSFSYGGPIIPWLAYLCDNLKQGTLGEGEILVQFTPFF